MVPGTAGTDLDDVAGHAPAVPGEFLQLSLRRHASATPWERTAEDVGDVNEVDLPADRACPARGRTQVSGGPEKLGVRIADVLALEGAAVQALENRTSSEPVLHIGHRPVARWSSLAFVAGLYQVTVHHNQATATVTRLCSDVAGAARQGYATLPCM